MKILDKLITFRAFMPVLIGLTAFSGHSCDRDKKHPGYIYFPDMTYSQAYETYDTNNVFANNSVLRMPVQGTISREMVPYPFVKTDEDRLQAGIELKNPLDETELEPAEGKRLYDIYCLQCHGELGDGKGDLFTSGRFPYPPASLISEKVQSGPEGEVYHVITVGWGLMGEHGSMIRPNDRWRIVNYVKNELPSVSVTASAQ